MELKKKKLLVIIQGNVGGAERMAVTVTKGLDPQLYDMTYYLVGMSNDNTFPIEDFIPRHWKVRHIRKSNPAILMIKLFWVLLKELPDTVFSTTLYINGKLLLFRNLFPNIRFVTRCENYLYTFKQIQLKRMRIAYRKADIIIAQTEEMKQELLEQLGIKENKVVVLHNPVDIKTIDNKLNNCVTPYPSDNMCHICACGKFSHQKGFDLLIEAFSLVKNEIGNISLYIIGKNDGASSTYYEMLLNKAKRLSCDKDIVFTGFQYNPYKYIKYADCFVLSSRWEGLPNVMLESLYLGTPVAAFKCIPIIERIINEGKDGYLAEKENVVSLASAIKNACNLGRIKSSYQSSTVEDFYELF